MTRTLILGACGLLSLAACAETRPSPAPLATAAAAPAPALMSPGERRTLGPALGDGTVRAVMFGDSGSTVFLMYGGSAGSPQSGRVVRLENVGGMLQVVYDGTAPNMAIQSGGVVRRVSGTTGGMIEIDYAPPRR